MYLKSYLAKCWRRFRPSMALASHFIPLVALRSPRSSVLRPERRKKLGCYAKASKQENASRSFESDPAPPLLKVSESSEPRRLKSPLWKKIFKQVTLSLSSFPLAIGELFVVAALSSVGTVIEQGQRPEYYFLNFPEEEPVFGFFTWKWIFALGLDHLYSAPYFLALLALLAASLLACTYTRQVPIVKVARRWSFKETGSKISKLEESDILPDASLQDLGVLLVGKGYEVFMHGCTLYAFKGLPGRLAPIGVHAALLLIMAGGLFSAIGGYHGTVSIPQGLDLTLGEALIPNGFLSMPSPALNLNMHVNKFYIDQYPSGEVKQFYTDLSVIDPNEGEVARKTISVNNPLRIGGATIYQTDWGMSTLLLRVDGSGPYNLAMAPLRRGDNKLYGTAIPPGVLNSKGVTILARDLDSAVVYDKDGKFVGVRRVGSNKAIEVDGISIVVDEIVGSAGLECKMDPAVPVVYAGFAALMLTSCISYLSHSQIWALQDGTSVVVGGKTNRAKVSFKDEFVQLLDSVPEHSSSS